MTKQLTRQEVEGVIDRLADNTLSFGCVVSSKKEHRKHIYVGKDLYNDENYIGLVDGENCASMGTYVLQNFYDVLGHPITIGTVLEKIDKTVGGRNYYIGQTTYNNELIHLWSLCGELTQSLQDIIEASGWEDVLYSCETIGDRLRNWGEKEKKYTGRKMKQHLKSPEANELFSFLQEIL